MTDRRIAVICPSRDRPDGLKATYESMLDTSSKTTMIACIDLDQVNLYNEIKEGRRLIVEYGKRDRVCALVNRAVQAHPMFDIYVMMIDDARYLTKGWDEWLLDTFSRFPKRIGVVSPAHDGGSFLAYPVVSREWIDVLGHFAPPGIHRFTWDTAIELLGEATRLVYAEPDEFFIKHRLDERADALQVFIEDSARFVIWCATERRELVRKLRERINA